MLLGSRHRIPILPSPIDSIHNYYEHLVLDKIQQIDDRARYDGEFLADIACVALNHLPPRYIRHDVDLTFFMSPQEQEEIAVKVVDAVRHAIAWVDERERQRSEKKGQAAGATGAAMAAAKAEMDKPSKKGEQVKPAKKAAKKRSSKSTS